MTKARLFPLLTAALLLAACAAPEPEPTPTAVPTFTVEPTATSTPTATPSPTLIPLVKPFMIVEGMVFHQLCEAIQVEYPQAGCPIVAHEDVPLDHKFMAFMDENGELTGYGLDFGKEPQTIMGYVNTRCPTGWCQSEYRPTGYDLDSAKNPMWCGGQTGAECDSLLFWSSLSVTMSWGLDVGDGFGLEHIDSASKSEIFAPRCDECFVTFEWALFPISLQYQDVLEELGVQFVNYIYVGERD